MFSNIEVLLMQLEIVFDSINYFKCSSLALKKARFHRLSLELGHSSIKSILGIIIAGVHFETKQRHGYI